MKDCLLFHKRFQNLPKNLKRSGERSKKIQGASKLDNERKNCANMFPRVRKQTFFLETGVCFNYVSFIDHSQVIKYRSSYLVDPSLKKEASQPQK